MSGLIGNMVPVTPGNIVGGGVFVALAYWLIYLHGQDRDPEPSALVGASARSETGGDDS